MFASFIRDRGAQLRDQLSALQVRRPLVPLGVAALITALAVVSALRLRVMTGFEALLPESRASVQELKRVAARTSGVSTLFVMLQAGDQTPTSALRQLADALVPRAREARATLGWPRRVRIHEAARFLGPRAGLFLSKAKLESLSQDVEAHHARAVGEASGLLVSIDDAPKPAPLDVAGLRASLAIEGVDPARYPDGYYQSSDGRLVIVLVRSKVPGGDFDRGAKAIARIREVVDRLSPSWFDPQIRVAYSGDLATAVTEYQAINRDLTDVGLVGCLLIAAVVLLYYLRLRTVLCLVASIGVGVAWTFGATEVIVGSLNIAAGFLF